MYSTTTFLYRNSFLATFQLLFWLVFRPSAWQATVAHIDPDLPPDFALSKLSLKHWRHPILRRLLGLIYVVGPILTGIFVGLWLWWLSEDLTLIVRGVIYAIFLGFIGGLTCGITVSVAFGFVASIISSLLIGLSFGMDEAEWYKAAISSGILGFSLACSVLLSLASELSREPILKSRWFWAGSIVLVLTLIIIMTNGQYNPMMGGISNGLLFALLFALPFLLVQYLARNLMAGIVAGLLGSGGIYVAFFIGRHPDSSILLSSLMALAFGFSHRWWLQEPDVIADKKIEMPYITGVPLTLQNKCLFVGRTNVSNRIELLLQAQRSPPILLYGQRRMGKTSLLIFLKDLLPDNYIPLFIDFQGPVSSASDYSGFLYTISRAIIRSASKTRQLELPILKRNTLQNDPFTEFDEWLDCVEACAEDRVWLLTFDEFEALEHVFEKRRLDRNLVLGMFRHIIQHRPHFKILIAGAYHLDAFPHWANYLINVETVKLTYLQESEAIQLIEQTVNHFSLRYTHDATQRILTITHCHPALIQLLCKEIVFLKNQQPHLNRNVVQLEDVEFAVPNALESGKNYFIHITKTSSLEEQILHLIAMKSSLDSVLDEVTLAKECPSDELEGSLSNLLKRELIELTSTGYRFQVEFIRRWFIEL
ncbi:MAG: hypothetical protein DRQ49_03385 [Gammaproteobacteria bacterium]|nr:MAG: hypothetical protein DRQ49_03385 [Gammaproteobacteria bacterium]RKZ42245.1 MAG: hypothetical protein DRQ41_07200 [Gammaproteobacteria bacterium]RKZ76737.1 MAG: hypothetical protein DRQ57_02745 [Gammaproteobacteria bacterium]